MKSTISLAHRLSILRKKIEAIDEKILSLLHSRFLTTNQIQSLKRCLALPIHQKGREAFLLKKYFAIAKEKFLPKQLIKKIFTLVFSYAKKNDIMKRSPKHIWTSHSLKRQKNRTR